MTDAVTFADHDYKVMGGSVGPEVVDIRKFYADTGMFTYDPGFTSTASCRSELTYIDGDEGVLLHRGYSIGELPDRVAAVEQYAFVTIDIGDRAVARRGRGEAGIVGELAGLSIELADIDHVGTDGARHHGKVEIFAADVHLCGVAHQYVL